MTIGSWPDPPMPPEPPGWPQRPDYPYPPMRPIPQRTGPVMVPMVYLADDNVPTRRVMASGRLDAEASMRLSGELMELDGRSADDVELVINSEGGRLADVLGLLDVISSMRARVNTLCLGRAIGTAAVLLACGTGTRRAGPHATISLRCREPELVAGPTASLHAQLDDLQRIRQHLLDSLAMATDRLSSELAAQFDDGSLLDAQQAASFGIIDPPEDR